MPSNDERSGHEDDGGTTILKHAWLQWRHGDRLLEERAYADRHYREDRKANPQGSNLTDILGTKDCKSQAWEADKKNQ